MTRRQRQEGRITMALVICMAIVGLIPFNWAKTDLPASADTNTANIPQTCVVVSQVSLGKQGSISGIWNGTDFYSIPATELTTVAKGNRVCGTLGTSGELTDLTITH